MNDKNYKKTAGEILGANQQLEREINLLIHKYQNDIGFNPDISIQKINIIQNGILYYDIKVTVLV